MGDGPVVRTQRGRAVRGHPAERPPGLVPVLHLLGHDAQIEGDQQHDRVGVAESPLPSGMGLFEDAASSGRITGALVDRSKLLSGQQHIGIVLTEIGPSQLNSMLKRGNGLTRIAGIGKGLGTLPGSKKRRRLGHAGHAARNAPATPVRPGKLPRYVQARGGVKAQRGAVYISLLCSPPGSRLRVQTAGRPGSAVLTLSGWRNGRRASLRC